MVDRPRVNEPFHTPATSRESLVIIRVRSLWGRFRRFASVFRDSRLGVVGLILLLIFIVMAVSAPFLTSMGLIKDPDAMLCGADFHVCLPDDPAPTMR